MSTQVSALVTGEVISDRYRLEERLLDATTGRAVWRGTDTLLNRKVAIEVQTPGGSEAADILAAAMVVSHVHHAGVIDVYDVVDEGDRALLIREWAAGTPLNKLVATGPLGPQRVLTIVRSAAAGVAALHAAGATHGNLIPRAAMVGVNDEVVLVDVSLCPGVAPETDVRAIGSLLYTALTGRWPGTAAEITARRDTVKQPAEQAPQAATEPSVEPRTDPASTSRTISAGATGPAAEPRSVQEAPTSPAPAPAPTGPTGGGRTSGVGTLPRAVWVDGHLCSPRQMRAGIPGYLDELVMELLDERRPAPTAEQLAASLEHAEYAATSSDPGMARLPSLSELRDRQRLLPLWARLGVPVTVLVLVAALMGVVFGVLSQPTEDGHYPQANAGQRSPGESLERIPVEGTRIFDPAGDGAELAGADRTTDEDQATAWRTDDYANPKFGNLKPGMGVLIDLGRTTNVQKVTVWLDQPGATVELRAADRDRGLAGYQQARVYSHAPAGFSFTVPAEVRQKRYWLVWITELPKHHERYGVGVREIVLAS